MKTTLQITFMLLFSCFTWTLLYGQPGSGMRLSSEERAEQQTAFMTDSLALSEAQITKVKEVNLKYAQKSQEAREQAQGDWTAMRETMMAIQVERRTEMKTYLTEEQYTRWVQLEEARFAQRKTQGNRKKKD